jgi:hypothetical protein
MIPVSSLPLMDQETPAVTPAVRPTPLREDACGRIIGFWDWDWRRGCSSPWAAASPPARAEVNSICRLPSWADSPGGARPFPAGNHGLPDDTLDVAAIGDTGR